METDRSEWGRRLAEGRALVRFDPLAANAIWLINLACAAVVDGMDDDAIISLAGMTINIDTQAEALEVADIADSAVVAMSNQPLVERADLVAAQALRCQCERFLAGDFSPWTLARWIYGGYDLVESSALQSLAYEVEDYYYPGAAPAWMEAFPARIEIEARRYLAATTDLSSIGTLRSMTQRTVLVTGASTGIGRATALLLHERGFRVFAGVRTPEDAASVEAEGMIPLTLDVTNAEHIAAAAKAIEADGGLYGLVNNAGIASAAPLEFVPVDDLRHQLEVNVVGQVALTQAVLPLLRLARGRIVNITSIGGLIAGQMLGPYNASKFALEAVTHVLRQELEPWGIEVIAIEPGVIATPIWSTSAKSADRMLAPRLAEVTTLYGAQIEAAQKMAANGTRHGIPPIEVAKAIEKALTARRPKTRYPVGTDAKIGAALLARLPDRTRDRLLGGRRQKRARE